MEYSSFFIVLIYFPAKLTKVCRYKDFYLFIFPSANIIEGAEAHSPGQRPGLFGAVICRPVRAKALKIKAIHKAVALTGRLADCHYTQGVALGYELLPLQGVLLVSITILEELLPLQGVPTVQVKNYSPSPVPPPSV